MITARRYEPNRIQFVDNGAYLEARKFADEYNRLIDNLFLEAWHEVGGSGEPAFQNSWANFGSGFSTMAFMRDPFGFVHLKGTIDTGSASTVIFTLPENYRPGETMRFIFRSGSVDGGLEIQTDGDVVSNYQNSTPQYLNGIIFRVAV